MAAKTVDMNKKMKKAIKKAVKNPMVIAKKEEKPKDNRYGISVLKRIEYYE